MTIAHDAHPHDEEQERPHACNDGWVTIGQEVIGEDGEEQTEYALYLCKLCAAEKKRSARS